MSLFTIALAIAVTFSCYCSANASDGDPIARDMSLVRKVQIQGFVLDVSGPVVVKRRTINSPNLEYTRNSVFTYNLETGIQSPDIVIPNYDRIYSETPAYGPLIKAFAQPQGDLLLLVTDLEYLLYNYRTGEYFQRLDSVTDPRSSSVANIPVWSESGRYLAFTDRKNRTLRVFDSKTGVTKTLRTNLVDSMISLKWSPDETRLLFSEGETKVLVLDLAGKVMHKISWFWSTKGPVYYVGWLNNNQVKVGNNFREEYYSLNPLHLVATAESGSNHELFKGRGKIKDAMGRVASYEAVQVNLGVENYSKPLIHPEFPDQTSFQYTALAAGIFMFDYGTKGNIYFVNSQSEILFSMQKKWGRPDHVHYNNFRMVGNRLVVIDQLSGFQYFQINHVQSCKKIF